MRFISMHATIDPTREAMDVKIARQFLPCFMIFNRSQQAVSTLHQERAEEREC